MLVRPIRTITATACLGLARASARHASASPARITASGSPKWEIVSSSEATCGRSSPMNPTSAFASNTRAREER